MLLASKLINWRSRALNQKSCDHGAFTLVETMVSILLLALILGSVVALFSLTTRSTLRSGALSERLAQIDEDISKLRRLSETYTCCDGPCTITPASICAAKFRKSTYYFPSSPSNITAFENSCRGGGGGAPDLTSNLITSLRLVTPPLGVARTINKDTTSLGDHLINVQYLAEGIDRVYKIYPIVASWCP